MEANEHWNLVVNLYTTCKNKKECGLYMESRQMLHSGKYKDTLDAAQIDGVQCADSDFLMFGENVWDETSKSLRQVRRRVEIHDKQTVRVNTLTLQVQLSKE